MWELGTGSACLALMLTTESVGQADVCLKASMTGMVAARWWQLALLVYRCVGEAALWLPALA